MHPMSASHIEKLFFYGKNADAANPLTVKNESLKLRLSHIKICFINNFVTEQQPLFLVDGHGITAKTIFDQPLIRIVAAH